MLQVSTNLLPPKTPSRTRTSHRLLYRGSLSLTGSKITLDGLTFSTSYGTRPETPGSSIHAMQLLENPLALALETMRGRPSLRIQGTVKLKDVWIDDDGGVRLDIHPRALISRTYFQNIFCLRNSLVDLQNDAKSPQLSTKRSELGLKVSLGDTDGLDTTQVVIYACPSADSKGLKLCVARIVQAPALITHSQPNAPRLPRPDDPTPRRPPERLLKRALTRSATSSVLGENPASNSLVDPAETTKRANIKKKPKVVAEADDHSVEPSQSKKRKRAEIDEMENKLERANKNIIKVLTTTHLTTRPMNLSKSDQEFKDLYSMIYRGVQFALRHQLKNTPIDPEEIEKLVQAHATLYITPTNN